MSEVKTDLEEENWKDDAIRQVYIEKLGVYPNYGQTLTPEDPV